MIPDHFNLTQRLPDVTGWTALDLGCGPYESDVARQILSLPLSLLVSMDGYAPDLERASFKEAEAKEQEFVHMDLRRFSATERYDLVTAFDVLEHFTKEDGYKFLKELDRAAERMIVLFVPIEPDGFHREREDAENVLQDHLSHWKPHELKALGYEVEEITGCHGVTDENGNHVTFGAMWAVKHV